MAGETGVNSSGVCDEAKPIEFRAIGEMAEASRVNGHSRKIRRVLVFEIETAGDARGTAGAQIGAGTFANAAAKSLSWRSLSASQA